MNNLIVNTRNFMRSVSANRIWRRVICVLMTFIVILTSLIIVHPAVAVESLNKTANIYSSVPTENITRIADNDTSDDYIDKLLSRENGSRNVGRVWSDKSVFSYGSQIKLDNNTDGYNGTVDVNSDFAHMFSTIASSQITNIWPPAPIDLVIAIDMSASMAQSSAYAIDATTHEPMAERINNSRIKKTLDAVNNTISNLMEHNRNNRVSVVVYGAGASVLMPLAHYEKIDDAPYITIKGMETLYGTSDLTFESGEWYWTKNRDAAYTITASAMMSESNNSNFEYTEKYEKSVSNNVKNQKVKAYPGYEEPTEENLSKGNTDNPMHGIKADEYVGYFTNTQGGIFLAYEQLAKSDYTTYTEKLSDGSDTTVARIPAAMIMTDGGANFAFNEMDVWDGFYGEKDPNTNQYYTDQRYEQDKTDNLHRLPGVGDEWYKVFLPDPKTKITSLSNDGLEVGYLYSQPEWYYSGVLYSNNANNNGAPGTILQILMTASYMKAAASEHYEQGWNSKNATSESRVPIKTYTLSVDSELVPQWGRIRLYPSMDPQNYFLDHSKWNSTKEFSGSISFSQVSDTLNNAVSAWETWKSGSKASAHIGSVDINFSTLPDAGYKDDRYGVTITNKDVIDNIVYSDGFYDVSSENMGDKFQSILDMITGNVFRPLSGDNDAGVKDAVTYQDPIGQYMELKNNAVKVNGTVTGSSKKSFDMSMLLFGKMHGLVRSAVYDFSWNDRWMELHNPSGRENVPFEQGWYKGSPEEAADRPAETKTDANGLSYPVECDSVEDAWEKGWVMRLNFETMLQYVPIENADVNTNLEDLSPQIKSTTYTVYRFVDNEKELNTLRINPIYGSDVPKELQDIWNSAGADEKVDNRLYKNYDGVYRLSDIRVWAENIGDFIDSDGVLTPESASGYSDSLYVNIPVAAIPTQLANITLGPDGPLSYIDNLDDKQQSTPLRLIYAVGLTDDLIERDETGKQTGINIANVSADYLKDHTDSNNRVWFLSNYYSDTPYSYVTDEQDSCTRGDPTVSFAPSEENRFYVVQKPLPLATHMYRAVAQPDEISGNNTGLSAVDNQGQTPGGIYDKSNSKTVWEDGKTGGATWAGGEYMGTYQSQQAYREAALKAISDGPGDDGKYHIKDMNGITFVYNTDPKTGGIVYFSDSMITKDNVGVQDGSDASKGINSDDYYFLIMDYYEPDTSRKGVDIEGNQVNDSYAARQVQYVVARKGAELGSGINSQLGTDDLLSWSDMNRNTNIEFNFVSPDNYTSAGAQKDGYGAPTYQKLTLEGQDLRKYLADLGFSGKALESQINYWTNMRTKLDLDALNIKSEAEFNESFNWVLSVCSGAVGVGDMFESIEQKSPNKTLTAENYYIPTVSDNSGIEDSVIINLYLGNNGKLSVEDTMLLVTKEVDLGDLPYSSKEYNYQVYIQGFTGTVPAIVVTKNEYTGKWQRRISTVDLLTDNNEFLMSSDNNLIRADADGTINPNGDYYIYVGHNTADGNTGSDYSLRIFNSELNGDGVSLRRSGRTIYVPEGYDLTENPDKATHGDIYKRATPENPAGSSEIWISDVYVVPISDVESGAFNKDSYNFAGEDSSFGSYLKLKQFSIATYAATGEGSLINILSDYAIRAEYLTKYIEFGAVDSLYDGSSFNPGGKNVTPETAKVGTAYFTLKDGEGLLFRGISHGADYRFTEKLQEYEIDSGYAFNHVDHETQSKTQTYTNDGNTATGSSYRFDSDAYTYSVFGETSSYEQAVHYNNEFNPVQMTVSKSLAPDEGAQIRPDDYEKSFDFTIKLAFASGKPINGFYWFRTFSSDGNMVSEEEKELNSDGITSFKLKGGQYVVIYGLPVGAKYTYNVSEADQVGWTPQITVDGNLTRNANEGYTGSLVQNGGNLDGSSLNFTNVKAAPVPEPVSLSAKKVVKTLDGASYSLKENDFSFMISPFEDNPEDDPIPKDTVVTNKADGSIMLFDNEYFNTNEGIYRYTVKELKTKLIPGMTYDDTQYTVTVTVKERQGDDGYIGFLTPTVQITKNSTGETVDAADFTFTNIYEETGSGNLSVSKTVDKYDGTDTTEFNFTVSFTGTQMGDTITAVRIDSQGRDETLTINLTKVADKSYTCDFTLKDGQTITFINIPEGTSYSVSENMKGIEDQYLLKSKTGDAGNINKDTHSYAAFVNVPYVKLPDFGGIGTIPFYVFGTLVILIAGASLVYYNKKRRIEKLQ